MAKANIKRGGKRKMLTCFQETTNLAFQNILKFFVKQNSLVLDITYGRGFSWKNLKETYKIIKIDKRKINDDVIQSDFNDYLLKKEDSSVDCIYFDPPYYFKEKIKDYDIKKQMFNEEKEVFWTEDEFNQALNTLQNEVPRVLRKRGIIIIKMMDGYIGKYYYPNTFKVFNSLSNVMTSLGIFICPIQRKNPQNFIRENHIYYVVFQNIKEENKNEL